MLAAGVGFSLWRAAFLADAERPGESMRDSATAFFAVLVRDNAIGYPQDRDNRAWTAGYYLNNAFLRLDLSRGMLNTVLGDSGPLENQILQGCERWLGGQVRFQKPDDLQECWDDAFALTAGLLTQLEHALQG